MGFPQFHEEFPIFVNVAGEENCYFHSAMRFALTPPLWKGYVDAAEDLDWKLERCTNS